MWGRRRQRVVHMVVAVVYQPDCGFFVSFNDKWGGYAFPMRKRRPTDLEGAGTALEALRDAVRRPLPRAEARPLEYLEWRQKSGRTGLDTYYCYQAFEVEPNEALPGGELGSRHGFLSYEQLQAVDRVVTRPTRALSAELMDNQHVALAVITRPGPSGREYLMIRNARYQGYFLPASRIKTDTDARSEAVAAARRETGYLTPVAHGPALGVEDTHFSPRFQRPRRFVYHPVAIVLPGLDLTVSPNELERSLARTEAVWQWFAEEQLADPRAHDLSEALDTVRDAVIQAGHQGTASVS